MLPYIFPLIAFLLGSIPFGLYIARSKGINIREVGSNNIGATNVLRSVGKRQGLLCFVLDVLKGAVPVLLAVNLLGVEGKEPLMQWSMFDGLRTMYPAEQRTFVQAIQVITGLCAVLGHNYSPWVGFKGGKGIATTAGVILSLMPFGFLIVLLIWIAVTAITRYVAVGSIAAAIALPLVNFWGTHHHKLDKADPDSPSLWEAGVYNKPLMIFTIVAGVLATWKHRTNIQRLMNGTENRFGKK